MLNILLLIHYVSSIIVYDISSIKKKNIYDRINRVHTNPHKSINIVSILQTTITVARQEFLPMQEFNIENRIWGTKKKYMKKTCMLCNSLTLTLTNHSSIDGWTITKYFIDKNVMYVCISCLLSAGTKTKTIRIGKYVYNKTHSLLRALKWSTVF